MKALSILLSMLIIFSGPFSFARTSEEHSNSLNDIFLYRSPDTWKGETFMFHEKPFPLQKFHYLNIVKKGSEPAKHPSYQECSGKKVIVSGLISKGEEFIVTLNSEDGSIYETATLNGSIDGLIPLKDIQMAEKYLLNTSLWYLKENILDYNNKKGEYSPVYAARYSTLKVIAVKPGWNTNSPVRLILETPYQEEGFVDINLSGTNVPETVRNKNRFSKFFSRGNPARWSVQIKELIANHMIKKDMTSEQVRMSWGSPAEILKEANAPTEKWMYPYGDILIFEKDILMEKIKQ